MFTKIGKSKFMKIVLYITTFAFVGSGVVALLLYKLMGGIEGIAEVNGKSIPVAEVLFRANQLKLQLEAQGINVDDKSLHKNIILTALDQAINDELIYQEAEKEGIEATKAEVAKFIRSLDVFRENGKFSKEMYINFLSQFNISPQLFESLVKKELSAQHLLTLHNLGFYITDEEIKAFVTNKQARIFGEILVIKPKNIQISESEIKDFYEKNKKSFVVSENPKVAIYKIDIKKVGEEKAKELAKKVFNLAKENKEINLPSVELLYRGTVEKISDLPMKLENEIKENLEEKKIIFHKDKDAFYIAKYEGAELEIAPYEEAKKVIRAKLLEEKSTKWAKENFDKVKKEFQSKGLEGLAKEYGIEIQKLEGASLPKLTSDLDLTPQEVDKFLMEDKGIFLARDKIIAFKIDKRILNEKEANIITKMFAPMVKETKKQSLFNMYIRHLREEADIKINKELLERL